MNTNEKEHLIIYMRARKRDKEECNGGIRHKRTDGKNKEKKVKGTIYTAGKSFFAGRGKCFCRQGRKNWRTGEKKETPQRTTNTEKKNEIKKSRGCVKIQRIFSSADEKRITTHPPHAFISNDSISTSNDRIQSLQ